VTPPKTETRSPLSRDVVADRALALADAEGIEAVTIRRLATDLGVTPMALYWHFRTKEDLLAGAADRVLDALEVPERVGDWTVDIRTALVALVTAMRPHPQVAQLVADRIMIHPTGLDLTELALATLRAGGFDSEEASYLAMQALRAAITMVTGDPVDDSGRSPQDREAQLRTKRAWIASLPPEKYPALVEHADAMTHCADVDRFFDLGVDLFVAGVRGLAPARGTRR
jgi:TetR/AcrR family tetracycline transcriptional repressor